MPADNSTINSSDASGNECDTFEDNSVDTCEDDLNSSKKPVRVLLRGYYLHRGPRMCFIQNSH